jgi:hypothetical protein
MVVVGWVMTARNTLGTQWSQASDSIEQTSRATRYHVRRTTNEATPMIEAFNKTKDQLSDSIISIQQLEQQRLDVMEVMKNNIEQD